MKAHHPFMADRHGASMQPDPIVTAIEAFHSAKSDFDASSGEHSADQLREKAQVTYEPAMRVLEAWDRPCQTFAGAVAALRLAKEENDEFKGSEIAERMVAAAVAFFDRPARDSDAEPIEDELAQASAEGGAA